MFSIRHTNLRPRKAAGFTLIELLVVITIILLLMAALMPMYSKIFHSAKVKSTQTMIQAVSASLESYRNAFDSYPPSPTTGTTDDGSLFRYLNGKDGRGVVANPGTPREKHYEPYLALEKNYYKQISGNMIIVDNWGEPIHYFNCKAYVEEQSGNPKFCHNPASIDLYSTGPDKKLDPELVEPGTAEVLDRSKTHLVDDITNF